MPNATGNINFAFNPTRAMEHGSLPKTVDTATFKYTRGPGHVEPQAESDDHGTKRRRLLSMIAINVVLLLLIGTIAGTWVYMSHNGSTSGLNAQHNINTDKLLVKLEQDRGRLLAQLRQEREQAARGADEAEQAQAIAKQELDKLLAREILQSEDQKSGLNGEIEAKRSKWMELTSKAEAARAMAIQVADKAATVEREMATAKALMVEAVQQVDKIDDGEPSSSSSVVQSQ